MSIEEEPIHFIYRERGISKMRFWTTVRGYLTLLAIRRRARARNESGAGRSSTREG
jgi:hypothetical protein